jgi:hypothetical protein
MLKYLIYSIVLLFLLYGISHFMWDVYGTLYRLYYDSTYFTQAYNSIQNFMAKWLPF